MAINNGDFVRLNFTGKIKENDERNKKYLSQILIAGKYVLYVV